jgi:hypothetical protein
MVKLNALRPKGIGWQLRFDADLDIRRHPPFFKGRSQPEHDLEEWSRFSKKIMLEQRDETMTRLKVIGL